MSTPALTFGDIHALAFAIEDALRSLKGKPGTWADIASWLRESYKPLPPHALRVLDALVDLGHVERIMPTDTSQRRYQLNPTAGLLIENDRAVRQRLHLLFDDDIAEAAAPAPAPIAKAPAETVSQVDASGKLFRETPAGKPGPELGTRIVNPSLRCKPPAYRPGAPVRERILSLIADAQTCSRTYILSRLWDLAPRQIDHMLSTLAKTDLIRRTAPAEYAAVAGVHPTDTAPIGRPRKSPDWVKPTSEERAQIKAAAAATSAIGLAFSGAAAALGGPEHNTGPVAIRNLPPMPDRHRRITVLRRLSPMLAADISAEIDAIANYLALHVPEAA